MLWTALLLILVFMYIKNPRATNVNIAVGATEYCQQMNILAILCNSFIEKYLVESRHFPESATAPSRKIEQVEAIALVLTGHFSRFGLVF